MIYNQQSRDLCKWGEAAKPLLVFDYIWVYYVILSKINWDCHNWQSIGVDTDQLEFMVDLS